MKLSVIVPVYKVEPYLERCLSHLVEQDISKDDYEIICVNDGSPDNSREIIKRFQDKHRNIKLIDQENQGVSVARNMGIKHAKSEYLLFIDSDDFVEKNTLKKKIQVFETRNAQVGFLGYTILDEEGNASKNIHYDTYTEEIVSGTQAYEMTHFEGSVDPDRIYAVIIERNFLTEHSLMFTAGVPYLEDGEMLTRILCLADKCFFLKGPFYLRTTRPGSATNSDLFNSYAAINGFIKSAKNLSEFKEKIQNSPEKRDFLNQPIVKYVVLAFSASLGFGNFKRFNYVYKAFKDRGLRNLELTGCNRMYNRLGRLYNISGYFLYMYLFFRPIGHLLKRIFRSG
jgi:glycosyltransferase involved in cell wall biosynthesis